MRAKPSAGTVLGLLVLTGAVAWVVRRGMRRSAGPRRPPVTQALVPAPPADMPLGPPEGNLDRRLDEALLETYPASDPISIYIE